MPGAGSSPHCALLQLASSAQQCRTHRSVRRLSTDRGTLPQPLTDRLTICAWRTHSTSLACSGASVGSPTCRNVILLRQRASARAPLRTRRPAHAICLSKPWRAPLRSWGCGSRCWTHMANRSRAWRTTGVRDRLGRRFPAHLDTRYSDEGWWHGPERYSRPVPWYTYDRDRERRDARRSRRGTPSDHQLPQPGTHLPSASPPGAMQPGCGTRSGQTPPRSALRLHVPTGVRRLDDRSGPPVHAPGCPCGCDVA